MITRPLWTLPEKSVRLWIADDVTVDPTDRETVAQAWKRLFEEIEIPSPVASWSSGDANYRLLPTGHVLKESLWGNSEIRLIRQADQVRLFCKHDWKIVGSQILGPATPESAIPESATSGSATSGSAISGSAIPGPATSKPATRGPAIRESRGSQSFGPVILGAVALGSMTLGSQALESQASESSVLGFNDTQDPLVMEVRYACEACSSWTYHRMKFVGYQRESLEHRLGEIHDEPVDNGKG